MPGPWLGRRARLQSVILPQCIDSGLDRAQGVAQQKGLMGVDAQRAGGSGVKGMGGGRQQLAGAVQGMGGPDIGSDTEQQKVLLSRAGFVEGVRGGEVRHEFLQLFSESCRGPSYGIGWQPCAG